MTSQKQKFITNKKFHLNHLQYALYGMLKVEHRVSLSCQYNFGYLLAAKHYLNLIITSLRKYKKGKQSKKNIWGIVGAVNVGFDLGVLASLTP